MSWYAPLPVDEYRAVNEKSGTNVPSECPKDSPISSISITCGPILKLSGTLENNSNNYRGSILLVVKDAASVPELTYKIGPLFEQDKADVRDGSFAGEVFFKEEGFSFVRYKVDLKFAEYEQKVQYSINGETLSNWVFYIPSVEQSMNVISFSCNGFSLATDATDFKSSLWFDVLNKHKDTHYHVMLGGGDQIYADSIKLASKHLQDWMEMGHFNQKSKFPVNEEFSTELSTYYLNHYMAWFGKGYWKGKVSSTLQTLFPMAMATIPSVNIFDDHDIIDGYGSYTDRTMRSPVFKAIGSLAFKYYMIFQHHQLPNEQTSDPSWIIPKSTGPYIDAPSHSVLTKLGKNISLLGIDCRTERTLHQVVSSSTYNLIFDRLKNEVASSNGETKHLLVMLGVPILYPRLVWLEWLLTSSLLKPVRKLAAMGVVNKGLVNEFDGGVEVLDDLNDHWCSKHHKRERNKLLKDLIEFGAKHSVRITILSGDVHLCCIGRLKSKYHHYPTFHPYNKEEENKQTLQSPEHDPRLLFNVTSSAIVNAPPPDPMATLLNKRSKVHHFNADCDEDVVPLFQVEPNGEPRANLQFLNKRNWSDLILAPQSIYKKDISETDPVLRFPGPAGSDLDHEVDEHNMKYPLLEDSLVTTIHVEDDPNDFDCNTRSYELLIPPLREAYKLNPAKIKHL